MDASASKGKSRHERTAAAPSRRGLKEAQILAAARRLLESQGFAGCSMDAVSAEAKVSKATLYAYHASKEALFAAVIDQLLTEFFDPLGEAVDGAEGLAHLLTRFSRRALEASTARTSLALYRLLIGESLRMPKLARIFYERSVGVLQARLEGILRVGRAAGEVEIGDIALAAEQFISLLLGPRHVRALLGLSAARAATAHAQIAEASVAMFLRAYAPAR